MPRFQAGLLLGSVIALACADTRVTGPEAKTRFIEYRNHGVNAKGFTIYLNGHVVSEEELKDLKADDIDSIEVIKGAGVVRIFSRTTPKPAIKVAPE